MSKIQPDEYRIVRVWNDLRAEYVYRLNIVKYERTESYMNDGDRAWAERQAEHYGIEIEEAE